MRTKTTIALVLLCGLTWLLWPSDDSQRDEGASVINRLWLDRIPHKPTDKFNILILVDDPEKVGVFQHTSAFEGDYSVFAWQRKDARHYRLVTLQDDRAHNIHVRVSERDCKGFDYCMQVDGAPRGAQRYYSMSDWVITVQGDDVAGIQRQIAAQVDRIIEAGEAGEAGETAKAGQK